MSPSPGGRIGPDLQALVRSILGQITDLENYRSHVQKLEKYDDRATLGSS